MDPNRPWLKVMDSNELIDMTSVGILINSPNFDAQACKIIGGNKKSAPRMLNFLCCRTNAQNSRFKIGQLQDHIAI